MQRTYPHQCVYTETFLSGCKPNNEPVLREQEVALELDLSVLCNVFGT